jgi:hypothetical protein
MPLLGNQRYYFAEENNDGTVSPYKRMLISILRGCCYLDDLLHLLPGLEAEIDLSS